jgi:hypothetical protein
VTLVLADGTSCHPAPSGAAKNPRETQSLPWLHCAVLAILSSSIFLLNTRYGVGIRPDSLRYMGLGWKPDDAPIYGWLLRGVAHTGIDIWTSAKLVGFVLSCVNPILIWYTLMRATRSNGHAAVGTVLIVLSPTFSRISATAWSEALFIACVFTSALFFVQYLKVGNWRWLVACGAMIAVTTLVRFPGFLLGLAMALTLILMRNMPLQWRVRSIAVLGGVGGGITICWAIVSELVAGQSVGRDFAFYGNADAARFIQGLNSLSALLIPTEVPLLMRVALLFGILAATAWLWFRYSQALFRSIDAKMVRPERIIAPLFGFIALFYAAFMVLAVQLEANLPLNGRYALPLYVTLVVAATIVVSERGHMPHRDKAIATALVLFSFVFLASHVFRTAVRTKSAYEQGLDFASLSWANSPTIEAVRKLPRGAMLYSNGPEAIIYAARRPATIIPMKADSRTGLDRPHNPYRKQLEAARQRLQRGNAYMVFVDGVDWRFYTATESELTQALGLRLVTRLTDGRIYELSSRSPSHVQR